MPNIILDDLVSNITVTNTVTNTTTPLYTTTVTYSGEDLYGYTYTAFPRTTGTYSYYVTDDIWDRYMVPGVKEREEESFPMESLPPLEELF